MSLCYLPVMPKSGYCIFWLLYFLVRAFFGYAIFRFCQKTGLLHFPLCHLQSPRIGNVLDVVIQGKKYDINYCMQYQLATLKQICRPRGLRRKKTQGVCLLQRSCHWRVGAIGEISQYSNWWCVQNIFHTIKSNCPQYMYSWNRCPWCQFEICLCGQTKGDRDIQTTQVHSRHEIPQARYVMVYRSVK
jgi:hypothetical protein